MNEIHEANRRRWDDMAADWEERLNRDGLWRRCHRVCHVILKSPW